MEMFCVKDIKEIQEGYLKKIYSVEEIVKEIICETNKYERFEVWNDFEPSILLDDARKAQELIDAGVVRKLSGILFGVKDIMNTYNYTTEMGSTQWKGFTAGNDARVVHQMKEEGGIIAGKTVTAEFAVHALNATKNPYDVTKTPGTSSSGSAVAVALGLVPVALATQTAGSIIRPSSFCGVFGYKPSFGLVSRVGILKTADTLDSVGFITTNIKNIRTVFDVITVKGPDYPFSYKALRDNKRQTKGSRPWKVAFIKTYTWNNSEDYVKENIIEWVQLLAQNQDVDVEELEINQIIDGAHQIHQTIYNKSLAYYFEKEALNREEISDTMKEMILKGNEIDIEKYFSALESQEKMIDQIDEFFEQYDVIVSMSTASEAVNRGEKEEDDPSLIWNMVHLPTVNVPAFKNKKTNLPFGIQFAAKKYNDYLLINFLEDLAEKELIPRNIMQMKYKEYDL